MGGGWRMPTKAEFQELIDRTTHPWTTVRQVKGRKFTSRSSPTNFIFLSASGLVTGSVIQVGLYGTYWASTYESAVWAWLFIFGSELISVTNDIRYYAQPVRGVLPHIMGGGWRMPTKGECQELIDGITPSWQELSDVGGMLFWAMNGADRYVFFPHAGYYAQAEWVEGPDWRGGAYAWSSSAYQRRGHTLLSWFLKLAPWNYGVLSWDSWNAQSVRAVLDPIP